MELGLVSYVERFNLFFKAHNWEKIKHSCRDYDIMNANLLAAQNFAYLVI